MTWTSPWAPCSPWLILPLFFCLRSIGEDPCKSVVDSSSLPQMNIVRSKKQQRILQPLRPRRLIVMRTFLDHHLQPVRSEPLGAQNLLQVSHRLHVLALAFSSASSAVPIATYISLRELRRLFRIFQQAARRQSAATGSRSAPCRTLPDASEPSHSVTAPPYDDPPSPVFCGPSSHAILLLDQRHHFLDDEVAIVLALHVLRFVLAELLVVRRRDTAGTRWRAAPCCRCPPRSSARCACCRSGTPLSHRTAIRG